MLVGSIVTGGLHLHGDQIGDIRQKTLLNDGTIIEGAYVHGILSATTAQAKF